MIGRDNKGSSVLRLISSGLSRSTTLFKPALLFLVVVCSFSSVSGFSQENPYSGLRSSGGVVQYSNQELVRNGDFNLGQAAWATVGSFVHPSDQAARDAGGVGIQLWTGAQGEHQAYIIQEIYPPTRLTRAAIALDYRIGARMQGAFLQGFQVLLATTQNNQFQPFHSLLNVTNANYPGAGWQRFQLNISGSVLSQISTLRGQGKPIYIWIHLTGLWLDAALDNVSFRADGSTTFPPIAGMIAYRSDRFDGREGYEIYGISPDGRHTKPVFHSDGTCYGLAWRPDSRALAFSSSHEFAYSRWTADIYEFSRLGLRRITNPPSYAAVLASNLPVGSVTGKVRNMTGQYKVVAVYVEGAKSFTTVNLSPYNHAGDTQTFTIDQVADLGPGNPQYVVAREAGYTWHAAMGVDVQPGRTVQCPGDLQVDKSGINYTASSPTWRYDGSALMFTAGPLLAVPTQGGYGTIPFGWRDSSMCLDPAWSPRDDRLLYVGSMGSGIWLVQGGGNPVKIISSQSYTYPEDPAWLPDGSGFIYTERSSAATNPSAGRDIYLYSFSNRRSVQLTQFHSESAEDPAVSPDGRYIVFVRYLANNAQGPYFRDRKELWIMQLNNPAVMWPIMLSGNPSFPDWSRSNPQ